MSDIFRPSSQSVYEKTSNSWRKRPATSVSEIVGFEIPSPSRTLTKEQIAVEYAGRMTRPIPAGYKATKRTSGQRIDRETRMPFAVFKVYDSGKATFVSQWETWERANAEAGKMRDAMTDDECGKDFTYLARERRRGYARRQPRDKTRA